MTVDMNRSGTLVRHNKADHDNQKRKRDDETDTCPIKVVRKSFRTVLYGHAAYSVEIEKCFVPKNTTFTVYAPEGALLDKGVSDALANGEEVSHQDIETKKDPFWFFNRSLVIPEFKDLNTQYPKKYLEGDEVPDFCLHEADLPQFDFSPIQPGKSTTVVRAIEAVFLSDLFVQHEGKELHWAACSFSRDDKDAIGYGYATTLKSDRLKKCYLPRPVTEEVKKNRRLERFGAGSI